MFRVMMVLDALHVGGTETHVLTLTRELLKRGVHVVICADESQLSPLFAELDCPVYTFNFLGPSLEANRVKQALVHVIQVEQIQLLHVHQIPSGLLAAEVAAQLHIPVVFTVHGTFYEDHLVLKMARLSQGVVSVSPPVFEYLKHRHTPSDLIANGIDLMSFRRVRRNKTLQQTWGIPKHAVVVLYASRLSWEKASVCKRVVRACRDLRKRGMPSLHLIVAGDGLQGDDVRKYAQKLEHDDHDQFVHFLGAQTDMRSIYSVSDCVVGTGRVTLEAMACKCPVVAVGSSGFFGVLEPGRYDEAWIHYFGDHTAPYPLSSSRIRHSLQQVLDAPVKAQGYGNSGRAYVKKYFGIYHVTSQLLQVYERVVGV